MKNFLTASIVSYFSRENLTLDIALSTAIVVGCAFIGFLSRSLVMDLQANLFILS